MRKAEAARLAASHDVLHDYGVEAGHDYGAEYANFDEGVGVIDTPVQSTSTTTKTVAKEKPVVAEKKAVKPDS